MWDFSQPYRTELWCKELEGKKLQTPIAIPSLNRPDAPIFKSFLSKTLELDKTEVFIFIRDTKEQYDLYKPLENRYTLIPLPDYVKEIGLTRESIIQWGIKTGYNNLFMFDDRLTHLLILAPKLTRNNKLCMGEYVNTTNYKALLLWEYLCKLYPTTLSGVPGGNNFWYPENINREFKVNNPGSAYCYINIDLNDCKKFDLHYYNTLEYGTEDICFVYNVLAKGLPIRVFTDLAFKEIYPEKLQQKNPNGGSNISSLTRIERLLKTKKIFWTQTLGLDWETGTHPGLKLQKHKSEDIIIKFNFSRYWSKYYEEHKAK